MTQIKTDGIGFQLIDVDELPRIYTTNNKVSDPLTEVITENSTDAHSQQSKDNDPLMNFIARKKKKVLPLPNRYSKKALAFAAYLKQKESPISPMHYDCLLMSSRC